eukprot:scaffold85065_cov35-Tisochrysis_lutea.AAC.4
MQVNTLNDRATLALEYARRSDEMPRPPSTIKHHPASLNLEMLTALLRECKGKARIARAASPLKPTMAGAATPSTSRLLRASVFPRPTSHLHLPCSRCPNSCLVNLAA